EGLLAAERHANTVKRNRMIGPNSLKHAVGRSAGAHIVFRMHLEEALVLTLVDDGLEMLVLEARPSQAGRGKRRKAETHARRQIPDVGDCVHRRRLRFPDWVR